MLRRRIYISAFLIASIPAWSATSGNSSPEQKVKAKAAIHNGANASVRGSISEQEKVKHVLSRFTFGARPGDVEKVRAIGIDAWFERQLNPEQIDDSALNKRLRDYPSIFLNTKQLLAAMPTEFLIRQVAQGKAPMPTDPAMAGLYQVLLAKMDAEKAKNDLLQKQTTPLTPAQLQAQQDEEEAKKKADQERAGVLADQLLAAVKNQRMTILLQMSVEDRIVLTTNLQGTKRATLLADFAPRERELFLQMGGNFRNSPDVAVGELLQAKVLRSILSERQLQEVMTDFWLNHFNVFLYKDSDKYYTSSYERDTLRPRALGKFKDLLLATAKDPAMLVYLDNWLSIGPDSPAAGKPKPGQKNFVKKGLNENYGREVMELHTVGVNGGYSQADVTNLSLILTGWTVDHPEAGGGFLFDPKRHQPGEKQWFGQTIREGGYNEGAQALEWLAKQPQTAHFISYKLAQRFVSDNPPASLVTKMANTFLGSDGDMKEVLRAMYRSPEFWSPQYYRTKSKTPLEFVASAFRATETDPSNPQALVGVLQQMGQPLYQMLPPTGYAMTADHWINTGALVDRLNFALSLANSRIANMKFDGPRLLVSCLLSRPVPEVNPRALRIAEVERKPVSGMEEALSLMEGSLVQGETSSQTRQAILRQLGVSQANGQQDPAQVLNMMTAMLIGSPDFQKR